MQPQTKQHITANSRKARRDYQRSLKRCREIIAEMDRLEEKIRKDLFRSQE